jgi:arabinogalactan endo-1,4-beta-galactosidase
MKLRLMAVLAAISVITFAPISSTSWASKPTLSNGADVSWLPQIEQAGSKFFDSKGHRTDALVLMKRAGLKVARVRLWADPPTVHGSLAEVLGLAKRIKKAGLDLVLDLHYSDWWADPGHQTKPVAWQNLTGEALTNEIHTYTAMVLKALANQKTSPKWVQIGNEIANGFLWPTAQLNTYSDPEFKQLALLLNSAASAVRESAGRPKVIIHLETGGDKTKTNAWLKGALANGLNRPDAVGLSYYSQWGGPIQNLAESISVVTQAYSLPVIVAETAYPNGSTSFTAQVLDATKSRLPGFEVSAKGQAKYAAKVCSVLRSIAGSKAVGVWWWEGFSPNATKILSSADAGGISSSSLVSANGRPNLAMTSLGGC